MHSPEASRNTGPGIKPPKSSRSLKTAVSLALVLALAGAVFYLLDPAGLFRTKQFAGPREALTLGLAHESLAALAMIARDRGYFSEAGLDVTVKGYKSGSLAMKGLLAGDVAMTTAADIPIVFESMARRDFRIVATIGSSDNEPRIIARKDRDVKVPADLRGKRIATQKASAVHFFLHVFLLQNGMTAEDVTLSFLKPDDLVKTLVDGEIDAFSMREPYISQAAKQLGDNALVFEKPGLYRKTFNVVVTADLLKNRPEVVRRAMHALVQAEAFAQKHPNQAIQIVAKVLESPPADIAAIWPDSVLKVSLDQSLLVSLEDEAKWVIGSKLAETTETPNYLEMVHVGSLKAVAPFLVSLIH
ncbi:MAG TPA: NrtA/SsuA/CpmA family ABC transporter substrate-binding protein [Acidiferrobacterales bacterium]|nr:NrtA/SsuA/CpmA family ABC transporter substrate-binding protein [Acidiferrobacterales bacterium]